MGKIAARLAVSVPPLAILFVAPRHFGTVVAVLAAVIVIDISGVLARAGARPVLLAAALPAVGLPVAVTLNGGTGWQMLPGWFAAGLLSMFALVVVFGRRSGVSEALGATSLAGLVVGLGASGAILLSTLPEGRTWVLGFAALLLAAEGGAALLGRRRTLPRWAFDTEAAVAARPLPPAAAQAFWASLLSTVLVGGALAVIVGDPFTPMIVVGVGLIAVLAAFAGGFLQRVAAVETGVADRPLSGGVGALTSAADAILIAAPLAYALARSLAT
ncbi:MAG TPA: hypothetical protein VML96_07030 [Egibacteraceae bacterium]|nr:hypothetical protein [Egibacteraceae bacterium]